MSCVRTQEDFNYKLRLHMVTHMANDELREEMTAASASAAVGKHDD